MAKTRVSFRIELSAFELIKRLATKTTGGNMSRALENIIYSLDLEDFYEQMARIHNGQFVMWRRLLEASRKVREDEEKLSQHLEKGIKN